MYKTFHIVLLLLLTGLCASAQEAGVFNSPKGLGAELFLPSNPGSFFTATAYVDIYGIPTSRCKYPGFRVNVSRQFIIQQMQVQDIKLVFYVGPGLSAGFVRDHDKGRGIDLGSLMSDNNGFMMALSADAGCHFDFGRFVGVDLSFLADAGLHIRRNEKETEYSATSVSIYNNGLWQLFYPQLTIYFKLR